MNRHSAGPRTNRPVARPLSLGFAALLVAGCGGDGDDDPMGPEAVTGDLRISTTTTGPAQDPDGYLVSVDGGAALAVSDGASATVEDVDEGDHLLLLSDIAPNCTVGGTNPRTVDLSAPGIEINFDVACVLDVEGTLAFESDRDGDWDIYLMDADGSNPVNLTDDPSADIQGRWSPDGAAIAFVTDRNGPEGVFDIYVMAADGSGQTRLTDDAADDQTPVWSPDGTKIAFTSNRDGNHEVYVMDADGSNPVNLSNNAAQFDFGPSWSPDGSKIAFASSRDGNLEIYVMDPDGSNPQRLTDVAGSDQSPRWSNDGTRIAFNSTRGGGATKIYVMNADGSGQVQVTTGGGDDRFAAWSDDDSMIAFESNRDGDLDIYLADVNGSLLVNLTTNSDGDSRPDWRP